MESLESLKSELKSAISELEKITIKKYGSSPWAPGVTDQHKSDSYSFDQYTDVKKAMELKDRINYLKHQINTYAQRAQAERARKEALLDSQSPKHKYVTGGVSKTTRNPAIAAAYDAQHRLFGMSKVKRAFATISGQKRKFNKLWNAAGSTNIVKQQEVADQLNKMFR